MFEEFDVTLHHLGPGNVAPSPEFRSGGTGDPGDRGGVAVMFDQNSLALGLGERSRTTLALALPGEESAFAQGLSFLRALESGADALGEPGHVGPAKCRHSNRFMFSI